MPRKSTLTVPEIKEALENPFEIWPPCTCKYCELKDFQREPTPDQKKAWVVPHKHDYDIVCCYGGGRGAKSQVAIAKGIWYALNHPGCTILVGAKTLDLLKRTALKYWKERFSIKTAWDHPLVVRAPGDHNKCLELANGSEVWFLYFDEFELLRGIGITFCHIEEASLLDDSDALEELGRRLSENLAVQNQLMITTNPEENKGWIHDTFRMEQFEPGYEGPPLPIGKLCKCQYCNQCLDKDDVEVEWVPGKDPKGRDAMICPRCPSILEEDISNKMIPRFSIKDNQCPGDQEYMRVVFFDPARNPHLKSSYRQTAKGMTDDEKFALYTEGKVVELRTGKAYFHYSRNNLYSNNIDLDYSKDIYWSFDFNVARQCSVICQERETPGGGVDIDVIDEIVIPPVRWNPSQVKAGPAEIAKQFLWAYPTFDKYVHFYGDPAAMNSKVGANDLSQFQIICNIISDPLGRNKHGELLYFTEEEAKEFQAMGGVPKRVKTMPVKVKGQTKVAVTLKVDSLNYKLKDSSGRVGIRINPRCVWLTKSLENLRWKEKTGNPMLDTQCDATDAKNPNKQKPRLVSHISDSLAYYVAKKWPTYLKPEGVYAVIPGETAIAVDSMGIIHEAPDHDEDEDREKTHKEKMEQLKAELAAIEVQKGSLLEVFHSREVFESGGTLMDFFGAGF